MDKTPQPDDPTREGAPWAPEVRAHFREQKVGSAQAASLETLLRAKSVSLPPEWGEAAGDTGGTHGGSFPPTLARGARDPYELPLSGAPRVATARAGSSWMQSMHRSGVGYLTSAVLAAGLTFAVSRPADDDTSDPIIEFASQTARLNYPPDFDLEGDPNGFREIVQDVFPQKDVFQAELPKEVASGNFVPSEGRFFTWSGEPGVSIHLKSSRSDPDAPAMLYIVRLTEKNERKFPKENTIKKLAGRAGKGKKVNVWRDGTYGYAMVQGVAINE